MLKRFFLSLLLSSLLAQGSAFAQNPHTAIASILENPLRPTMAQIKAAFPDSSVPNPIPGYDPRYLNHCLDTISRAIVLGEKAFPGATWAFLGRDSAYAADMFAAFYNAIGQPHRVVRLNASRTSFSDPANYLDFLRSAGYRPDTVENEPPFIILDRTQWRPVSQSRMLLKAAYAHHAARGGALRSLLRKINVIAIGTYSLNELEPDFSVDSFFSNGTDVTAAGPTSILSVELGHNTGQLSGHNLEWHGPFDRFERLEGGDVVSNPGLPGTLEVRTQILHEQVEILRYFSSPSFRARVAAIAAQLGVSIPALQASQPCATILATH